MKKLNLATLALSLALVAPSFAAYHQEGHPDIVIQTNVDYTWSSFLLQKVRAYMAKTPQGDPMEKTLTEPIIIEDYIFPHPGLKKSDEAEKSSAAMVKSINQELSVTQDPESGKSIADRLMTAKGIKEAKFRVTIDRLGFKANRAAFGITPSAEGENTLDAQVTIRVGNLLVKAESIKVAILLPSKGEYKTFVEFVMNRAFIKTPSTYVDEKGEAPSDIAFNFNLNVTKKDDKYNFKLLKSSFNDVQKFIDQNGEAIKLVPNLDVNPSPFPLLRLGNVVWILVKSQDDIEKKIANKEFNVKAFLADKANFGMSKDEIKMAEVRYVDMGGYLKKHISDIKALLLTEVFNIVSGGAGENLLKNVEKFSIPGTNVIAGGGLAAKIALDKLSTNEESHIIAKLSSGFCSEEAHKAKGDNCIEYTKPVREMSPANLDQSMDDITHMIKNDEADLVVSISEAYISHLLKTTFHAGMWTEALSAQPIEMNTKKNPNFMFMVLDQKGNFGTLVMDADYVGLKWYEKLAVGKKRIRVALKYKVTIEVNNKNGVPNLEINLADADFSDQVVKYGVPQWGVPSEIQTVKRFKKMVLKQAADEIKAAIGTKIEIPMPELNNMGFGDVEYVRFASDGSGRANLLLKVKDSAKFRHVGPEKENFIKNKQSKKQNKKDDKEGKGTRKVTIDGQFSRQLSDEDVKKIEAKE